MYVKRASTGVVKARDEGGSGDRFWPAAATRPSQTWSLIVFAFIVGTTETRFAAGNTGETGLRAISIDLRKFISKCHTCSLRSSYPYGMTVSYYTPLSIINPLRPLTYLH